MAGRKKMAFEPETLTERYIRQRREAVQYCRPIWRKATLLHWAAGGRPKDENRIRFGSRAATEPSAMQSVSMSEVGVVVSTISGRQIMRRFVREYVPRTQAQEVWADVMTKADRAMSAAAEAEIYESQMFRDGPIIGGVSWMRFELDHLEDPNGRLVQKDTPVWQMLWDPAARDLNLVDRRWHAWGSWWSVEEASRRFPRKVSDLAKYVGRKGSSWASESESPTVSVRIPWEDMQVTGSSVKAWDPSERAVWLERYEFWDVVEVYDVLTPVDPRMTMDDIAMFASSPETAGMDPFVVEEMTAAELKDFKQDRIARLDEEVPNEWIVERHKKVWKYAYFCDDILLEEGLIPTGYWTFLAMVGDRLSQPDRTDWMSMLERLVDAQSFVNLMLSALLRDIMINPKGVLVAEEGVFRNLDDAKRQWTAPGGVIIVPRGRLQAGKPYQYEAGGTGAYSSKVAQLLDFWREAVPRLAGFNPAALGQLGPDLRRISGEVVRQVQDTAMVSNAGLFQSLSFYRRDAARVVLGMMRELFGDNIEGLIELVGEEVAYREKFDANGDPLTDEMGQPVRELAIPPVEMWRPDAWREVAVEETEPTEEWRRELWTSLTESGGLQTISQPWPEDTLLSGQDVIDIMPSLTPRMRERMKAAWSKVAAKRRLMEQFQQQQMMMAMQPQQSAEAPPS